ncbi:MAG: hypothetical protein MHM6MM_004999 [Cercozoa sp. M6MM]
MSPISRRSGKTFRRNGLRLGMKVAHVTVVPSKSTEFQFRGRRLQVPGVEVPCGAISFVGIESQVINTLKAIFQKLYENADVADCLTEPLCVRCSSEDQYFRDMWFAVRLRRVPNTDTVSESKSEAIDSDSGIQVQVAVRTQDAAVDLNEVTLIAVMFAPLNTRRYYTSRSRVPDGQQDKHWAPSKFNPWRSVKKQDAGVARQRLRLSVAKDPFQVSTDVVWRK